MIKATWESKFTNSAEIDYEKHGQKAGIGCGGTNERARMLNQELKNEKALLFPKKRFLS
jgi:hypothetical protein